MTSSTIVLPQDQGPVLQVLADRIRVLADACQTGSKYEVFELTGPEGSGPPPHSHPWDEAYFMLDGMVDLLVDGRSHRAGAGDFVLVPGAAVHSFRIVSGTARFLVLTSGAGAGHFFQAMDREIGFPPPSFDAVCAVAMRQGLSLAV